MREETLPPGWVWTTLGEVADTTRKRTQPQNHADLKYVGMEHVEAHTMRLLGTVPASEMKSSAEFFDSRDVLYGRLRPYLNKVFCPDFQGLCSSEFIVFRKVSHLESRYLQYFLNSSAFVAFASRLNAGDRPRVNFNQLADYPFPLAPLAEQRRIVAKIEELFTRLDAGVTSLKRVQAALKRYKASVFKAACEGRLVAQDASDEPADKLLVRILAQRRTKWEADLRAKGKAPSKAKYEEPQPLDMDGLPDLPEGWCWTRVEQVGQVQLGRQRAPKYHQGPYMRPYLRVANVFEDRIDTSDVLQMNFSPDEYEIYRLEYGDVLLNEGQSPELLGRPAMYRNEIPGVCFQNTLIRFKASNAVVPQFALFVFRSHLHSGRFAKEATITTNIAHLSAGRFASIEFPLPPLAEQHRIVAELERQLSVVAALEKTVDANLARAARLRQAILHRAFTGRLVAQDPNDEPAERLLERIREWRSSTTTQALRQHKKVRSTRVRKKV